MRNFFRITFLASMVFALNPFASAAIENNEDDVTTVIVTGYSLHSRLLADLLQFYTKQPVVFITRPDAKEVMFVAAPRDGVENPPIKVAAGEFHNFINFAHPKQVVLLGEEKFIPKFYKDSVNPAIDTYVLNDKNWRIIAAQCEELFGISGLAKKYDEELNRLARGGAIVEQERAPEPKLVIP